MTINIKKAGHRLSNKSFTTDLGVSVEIDKQQLERVNTLLKAAPEKALLVYRQAFQRGLGAVRTQASKEIRARYDITERNLEPYESIRQRVIPRNDGVVGEILFAGGKIPLYYFNPSPKARKYTTSYVNKIGGWRVTTEVSAADNRGQMIRRGAGFIATFQSGHTGIYKRTGEWTHTADALGSKTKKSKEKLEQYYGYSVADMLNYGPVIDALQDRAEEVVSARVDHELLRALDEMAQGK